MKYLALAGGVGGAKLALGMSKVLSPSELTIVVNTGDDEVFHGLHVSPDVDTVMYTLAGLSNTETGWGITGETFQALERMNAYGADTWFNLGDKDLGDPHPPDRPAASGLFSLCKLRNRCELRLAWRIPSFP